MPLEYGLVFGALVFIKKLESALVIVSVSDSRIISQGVLRMNGCVIEVSRMLLNLDQL